MIILFIFGLLLGGISVFFALQNIEVITVSFFSYDVTGSLSLILLVAMACGVFITALLLLPELISNYFKYKNLKKENETLTEDLRKQKELTIFAKKVPPTSEEISKIENGAVDIVAN